MNDPIGSGAWRPAALDPVGGTTPRAAAAPEDATPERWLGELPEAGGIAGVPAPGGAGLDVEASAARVLSLLGRH